MPRGRSQLVSATFRCRKSTARSPPSNSTFWWSAPVPRSLPGPNGAKNAYPARLQQALTEKLPGVAVTVTTDVKAKRTAAEMVKTLPPALAAAKPALVIWQTGTVDAMQAVDTDQFSAALDQRY